jgi:hypothetical protein
MNTPIIALSSSSTKMLNAFVFLWTEPHERRQEPGEHEQQQADAVDADQVLDAEGRNPGVALDELEVARHRIEAAPEQQRLGEDQQRNGQRDLAHDRRAVFLVAADEEQQDGAGHRQRDERGENRKMHQAHSTRVLKCPSCPLCRLNATSSTQG